MLPMMRNGGKGRVQSGLPWAKRETANQRPASINDAIDRGTMLATILCHRISNPNGSPWIATRLSGRGAAPGNLFQPVRECRLPHFCAILWQARVLEQMAIDEDPDENELAAFASAGVSFTSRRILEVGCGDGRLTRTYAGTAASVIAVDPDAEAVALLAAELPAVDARAVAFDELVLPAHSVDVVLFAWSL